MCVLKDETYEVLEKVQKPSRGFFNSPSPWSASKFIRLERASFFVLHLSTGSKFATVHEGRISLHETCF